MGHPIIEDLELESFRTYLEGKFTEVYSEKMSWYDVFLLEDDEAFTDTTTCRNEGNFSLIPIGYA